MIGPAKEQKLASLFEAIPAGLLAGLHALLCEKGDTETDAALLRLIGRVAATRGIDLGATADQPMMLEDEVAELLDDDEPALAEEPQEPEEQEEEAPWQPPAFVPPRNAMHAFFLPFESLIIDPPRYAARIDGYLCSTSLPAIWRMLNDEASGGVIRDTWLKAELERDAQPEDYYHHLTGEMHAAARVVVEEIFVRARDSKQFRRSLMERLSGETGLGDFGELHRMLPVILTFRDEFAALRPLVARYDTDQAEQIASLIASRAAGKPALGHYLQLAVLSNLEDPALGLYLHEALGRLSRGQEAPSSVIAGHLLRVLEMQTRWLEERIETEGGDATLLDPFIGFSQLLAGVVRHRKLIGDKTLLARLEGLIEAGAGMYESLIETAAGALEAVMPTRADDSDEAAPDLGWVARTGDVKKLIRAGHDAAQFLQAGQMMAPLYGKTQIWRDLHQEVVMIIDSYVSKVTAMLANMAQEARSSAAADADYLLDLAELLADRATLEPLQRVLDGSSGAA